MTCILGLEFEGNTYIGYDSAAANGWHIRQTSLQKGIRVGEFTIGYTSSFRMGQLLQYSLKVKEKDDYKDDLNYMVTEFVPAVRECLKSGGYAKIQNNAEEGGEFLVGYRGKIYKIASDFQVNRNLLGIDACGCGETYALASLHTYMITTDTKRLHPIVAIMTALETAGKFSNGVCGPYHVLKG